MQSTAEINDETIALSMLNAVKSGATMKTNAAMESTNPVVRRVLADSLPNCIEMAYEISLYQNKHGYYQVPRLPQQDMQYMQNSYGTAPMPGNMPLINNQALCPYGQGAFLILLKGKEIHNLSG